MNKLINKQTGEEHICEKVVIDGMDYYVSDEFIEEGDFAINLNTKHIKQYDGVKGMDSYWKKVIATNNPNIDCPKVVDVVEEITKYEGYTNSFRIGFKHGYNKSQETHPFSEEDVEFFVKKVLEDAKKSVIWSEDYYKHLTKELLQIWKKQQPKIVYYE